MSEQTIVEICRTLDRARPHYTLVRLTGHRADIEAAQFAVEELRKLADRFSALVCPSSVGHYPKPPEKIATLTVAFERIANRLGALIDPADTLLTRIVEACPTPDEAKFWATSRPASLFGLALHEKKLAEELRTRGVLLWGEHRDKLTRVVNTQWLTAHGDIFRFVTGERPAGKRCRFCRLPEPHNSIFLKDVETPAADWKRPSLPIARAAQLHPQCEPFWLDWLAIARQYQSQAEADAADVAAGRTPGPVPLLPAAMAEEAPTLATIREAADE